uniref:Uncharacterized protein n=1 Tax=Timema shepardi TaxID=629360 RepID=A0A7R9B2V0_TIMSH|nr:unnamed protein product [Timema shepardi]
MSPLGPAYAEAGIGSLPRPLSGLFVTMLPLYCTSKQVWAQFPAESFKWAVCNYVTTLLYLQASVGTVPCRVL